MRGEAARAYRCRVIVPTLTPQVDTSPVIQTVAARQYGRWAPQFRWANQAVAARRDVTLKRSRKALDALQELHDAGKLTDEEFTRLAAQV